MVRSNILQRLARIFLSVVLTVSLVPSAPGLAFAAGAEDNLAASQSAGDATVVSVTVEQAQDQAQNQKQDQAQDSGSATQNQTVLQPQSEGADAITATQPREEMPLGFVYFESEDLTAGGIQQVAVAIDNASAEILQATLVYLDPQGTRQEVEASKCANSGALFPVQTEGAGTYQLVEMKATVKAGAATKSVTVNLQKEGANCAFSAAFDMGTSLSAQAEPQAEPQTSTSSQQQEGTTIYALDESGNLSQAANSTASTAAIASSLAAQAASKSRVGKLVVALDPGHGGSDSGAVGVFGQQYGIKESDINWKIAQACMAELKQYSNIEVFLTRAQNECPEPSDRPKIAAAKGANVFVSIHINSAPTVPSAKGAEVYYPNSSSYNNAAHVDGKNLSQNILDELVALGLTNRGIKIRNSENGSKYPDKTSTRDYYAVIAGSRELGMPGIIVEHAFISNAEDAAKLKDDAFLVELGKADARGIAKSFELSKSWIENEDGTWSFKIDEDTLAKNQWITDLGKRYWFNDAGIMVTGIQMVEGVAYNFSSTGSLSTKAGWVQAGDNWYYFTNNGSAQTGWYKSGRPWYYSSPETGMMVANNWAEDAGKFYYLTGSGAMRSAQGWLQLDGNWYYTNRGGASAAGWVKSGRSWYFINAETHVMEANKWIEDAGKKYFLTASGAMRGNTGWFAQDGAWYWIAGGGAAKTGWVKSGRKWYYLDPATATMKTGFTDVDSVRYYLDPSNGDMKTGWKEIEGRWYYFNGSGAMLTGWQTVGKKKYYFDAEGKMGAGWVEVDGAERYFHPQNGNLVSGWLQDGSDYYLLSADGVKLFGWQTVGGKKYYLGADGKMLTGEHEIDNQPCFFEKSGAFIGNGTPIMGDTVTNAAKMASTFAARSGGRAYPAADLAVGGAPDAITFFTILEEEAKAEGVRAEVLWAQVMQETGWLSSTYCRERFNFGGIGAVDSNPDNANNFKNKYGANAVRMALRAQVQHLKCYGSTEPLNQEKIDPRWWENLRGKAKLVEWLGIPSNPYGTGWASDPNYGTQLRKLMGYLGV